MKINYLWLKMLKIIEDRIDEIVSLCKSHKVQSISLFGSGATNQMNANSDIDLLVQFSDELDLLDYADNYFSLLEGLENTFGTKVDLVSLKSIKNPVLMSEIDRSKIELYAA